MIAMWEKEKHQSMDFCSDPRYAAPAFSRNSYERQIQTLDPDPWRSGLKANRANLDQFIRYVVDQRLIPEPIPVESLFHESVPDT